MVNFRVLLVYPNLQMVNLLPSNISILSACLRERGFAVSLFDTTLYPVEEQSIDQRRVEYLQVRPFDLERYGIRYKETDVFSDFAEKVRSFRPGLIALTMVEDTFPLALRLIRSLGNREVPAIAGGVHVLLNPEEILRQPEIDMICFGEGEEALPDVCERLARGGNPAGIPNIWTKGKGGIVRSPMRPLVDLDAIPYNDFTLFEEARFFRPMQGKVFRMIPIEVDRGCPYHCTFCAAPSLRSLYKKECGGQYFRVKSNGRILAELEAQVRKYRAEYLYFNSETFLAMNNERFQEFARAYRERIRLPFWCQSRIETITEDRVGTLEEMGCDRISVGIEHGNEEFRKQVLRKNFTNRQVLDAFAIFARHRIPVTVNNMIGFPGETRSLAFDTIRLNRAINADSTNCFAFKPYHGTHLREVAIRDGYLRAEDPVQTLVESTLDMPRFPKEEINGLLRTFPLYVKFPEDRFDEIRRAEANTDEGNRAFQQLATEYRRTIWGIQDPS
jgi:anaerobic magnesium-protoporphyrin IX monomethyl ester cyclase